MHIASYGVFHQRRFSDDVQHKKQRQRYLLATFFRSKFIWFFYQAWWAQRGRPKVLWLAVFFHLQNQSCTSQTFSPMNTNCIKLFILRVIFTCSNAKLKALWMRGTFNWFFTQYRLIFIFIENNIFFCVELCTICMNIETFYDWSSDGLEWGWGVVGALAV